MGPCTRSWDHLWTAWKAFVPEKEIRIGNAATDAVQSADMSSCLRFATANVQTLLPKQEQRSYANNSVALLLSKVAGCEQQFLGSPRPADPLPVR